MGREGRPRFACRVLGAVPGLTKTLFTGLVRSKDTLVAQLRDLAKQRSRGQTDENLIAEIGRIESATTLAKDDLVRIYPFCDAGPYLPKVPQNACKLRLTGIRDELKHVEKELKKNAPELKKVHNLIYLHFCIT